MSDKLQEKMDRLARSTAFPSNEDMTEGMSYRQWLEGMFAANVTSAVLAGQCTTMDAAQTATDLAGALLMRQALNALPKVRCAVCQKLTLANPCDECGPTLNDEPDEGGVDLAATFDSPLG